MRRRVSDFEESSEVPEVRVPFGNEALCAWCECPRGLKRPGRFCSPVCRLRASKARRLNQAKKHHGVARVAAKHHEDLAIAREIAGLVWDSRPPHVDAISTDDVRDLCEDRGIELDWSKNWPGAVFAKKEWVHTGRMVKARHVGSRARRIGLWRRED